jgi:hypothetical protein
MRWPHRQKLYVFDGLTGRSDYLTGRSSIYPLKEVIASSVCRSLINFVRFADVMTSPEEALYSRWKLEEKIRHIGK